MKSRVLVLLILLAVPAVALAETGYDAWLRYARLPDDVVKADGWIPDAIVVLDADSAIAQNAGREIERGLRGLLGRELKAATDWRAQPAIVVSTYARLKAAAPALTPKDSPGTEGYDLVDVIRPAESRRYLVVVGADERGTLYGAFALLRQIALGRPVTVPFSTRSAPASLVRWVNQWDNLDGTIERGYGGRSIFWDSGRARADLTRVGDYGRLLASVGVQAVSINNVNANPAVLKPEMVPDVARIAAALRPWGVRVALAIDFGSPQSIGLLPTYDPLDPAVAAWWKQTTNRLYDEIPDFAGFVLKADSEGRVGPSTYGRTHADAANVVARALQPHGGLIFYRGFVYDHHMDWQNPKNDRARAAYDNFHELDGKFDANVIIQVARAETPDRKSTRLNSSHVSESRMPSSA